MYFSFYSIILYGFLGLKGVPKVVYGFRNS